MTKTIKAKSGAVKNKVIAGRRILPAIERVPRRGAGLRVAVRFCGAAMEIITTGPARLALLGCPPRTTEELVASALDLGLRALALERLDKQMAALPASATTATRMDPERPAAGQPPDAPGIDFALVLRTDAAGRFLDIADAETDLIGPLPLAIAIEDAMNQGVFELARRLWGTLYESAEAAEAVIALDEPARSAA